MRGVVNKLVVGGMSWLFLVMFSLGSYAGVNPFKKSKNYQFGADVIWYENNDSAIKSGSIRDGSDINYYHLNIDKYRLLLRLGKNDPSGELENTRRLSNLAISDMAIDGRRLPLFSWCLQNQQDPGKKLQQNAVVVNDVCINAGGGGDFVINLDKETREILKQANRLEFIVEPYGRPIKLMFNMSGYASILVKINKPVLPVVVKEMPEPVPVVVKPSPELKPEPKPKSRPKARPKPVKMCYARPPADFKAVISAMAYPCKDASRKLDAETKISVKVGREKKRMAAKMQAVSDEKLTRQKSAEDDKRKAEWGIRQNALWISRCKRHWAKNSSPCYCEKYLDQAPAGIENTCGK